MSDGKAPETVADAGKKWRIATVEKDFADGKPKSDIEFYPKNASGDGPEGNKVEDVSTITEADVEKYVVKDPAAAETTAGVTADADAAAAADADAAAAADADAAAAADREKSTALAEPKGSVNEALANLIYDELRQVIHLNLDKGSNNKPSEATIDAAIQMFENDSEKNKKLPEHKVTSILQANNVNPAPAEVAQGGGRRRSKRRQPRRSAKQSKKGGRSRKSGSKNRRKQSRRRKH